MKNKDKYFNFGDILMLYSVESLTNSYFRRNSLFASMYHTVDDVQSDVINDNKQSHRKRYNFPVSNTGVMK